MKQYDAAASLFGFNAAGCVGTLAAMIGLASGIFPIMWVFAAFVVVHVIMGG